MDVDKCSYIVIANICGNCIKENGGKIVCLGEGCALVSSEMGLGCPPA